MNITTQTCETCNRKGKEYQRERILYDESGVKSFVDSVIRCGYHNKNTAYEFYLEGEN